MPVNPRGSNPTPTPAPSPSMFRRIANRFNAFGSACSVGTRALGNATARLFSSCRTGFARGLGSYRVAQAPTPPQLSNPRLSDSSGSNRSQSSDEGRGPTQIHASPPAVSPESKGLRSDDSSSPESSPVKLHASPAAPTTESGQSNSERVQFQAVAAAITNELQGLKDDPVGKKNTFMRSGLNRTTVTQFTAKQTKDYFKTLYENASGIQKTSLTNLFSRSTQTPVIESILKSPEKVPTALCMVLAQINRSAEKIGFTKPEKDELILQSFQDLFILTPTAQVAAESAQATDKQKVLATGNSTTQSFHAIKKQDTFNQLLATLLARGEQLLSAGTESKH